MTEHEKLWVKFVKQWKIYNPPFDNGYYLCGICGKWIFADEVTLDHIIPRAQGRLLDETNIQPAHYICNGRKGSQHWEPVVSKEVYDFMYLLSNMGKM